MSPLGGEHGWRTRRQPAELESDQEPALPPERRKRGHFRVEGAALLGVLAGLGIYAHERATSEPSTTMEEATPQSAEEEPSFRDFVKEQYPFLADSPVYQLDHILLLVPTAAKRMTTEKLQEVKEKYGMDLPFSTREEIQMAHQMLHGPEYAVSSMPRSLMKSVSIQSAPLMDAIRNGVTFESTMNAEQTTHERERMREEVMTEFMTRAEKEMARWFSDHPTFLTTTDAQLRSDTVGYAQQYFGKELAIDARVALLVRYALSDQLAQQVGSLTFAPPSEVNGTDGKPRVIDSDFSTLLKDIQAFDDLGHKLETTLDELGDADPHQDVDMHERIDDATKKLLQAVASSAMKPEDRSRVKEAIEKTIRDLHLDEEKVPALTVALSK